MEAEIGLLWNDGHEVSCDDLQSVVVDGEVEESID